MKKVISALVVLIFVAGLVQAQEYKQVKVNMANGLQLRGRDAIIENDTLTLSTGSMTRRISMTEVNSMLSRGSKAEKFALGCGAGCLGYGILNLVAMGGESGLDENELTMSQYVAGYILFTGISAATGYLIGTLLDPYEVVYIRESSFLNNVRINLSTNPMALQPAKGKHALSLGTPMLSLSYRF